MLLQRKTIAFAKENHSFYLPFLLDDASYPIKIKDPKELNSKLYSLRPLIFVIPLGFKPKTFRTGI